MGANLSYPNVDLSGKVAVVTGGNAGIGYETAKGLAALGAHTIIACRSEQRATTAIEQMQQELSAVNPDKPMKIEYMSLDLASFRSTKEFVTAFKDRGLPLHLLINNAGIFRIDEPLLLTEDGNDHLSHFLLTLELLPTILHTASSTGDGRIVILSSAGHKDGVLDTENLNGERNNEGFILYKNSKFFNVLHGYALQRRLQNVGVTVSTVHPGFVNSEIFNHREETNGSVKAAFMMGLLSVLKYTPVMKNTQDGAATTLNCAINPENNKQEHYYYANCKVTPCVPTARDEQLQEQLWDISIQKVKDWLSPDLLDKYGGNISTQVEVTATPTDQSEVILPSTSGTEIEATPKNEPEATSKTEPEETLKNEPEATPKTEPEETLKNEPVATPKTEPEAKPITQPEATPKTDETDNLQSNEVSEDNETTEQKE